MTVSTWRGASDSDWATEIPHKNTDGTVPSSIDRKHSQLDGYGSDSYDLSSAAARMATHS